MRLTQQLQQLFAVVGGAQQQRRQAFQQRSGAKWLGARRRSAILPTLVVVAVLVVAFALFTNVWTTRLWYRSFNFGSVFSTMLLTRAGLFLVFGLIMAGLVSANAAVAYRLRPRFRPQGPTSPLLARYR